MTFALFTSERGDYVRVERALLRRDLGLRILLGAPLACFVVVAVLTFILETS